MTHLTKKNIDIFTYHRVRNKSTAIKFQPLFLSLGINNLKGHFSFDSHLHDSYQIIFVEKGTYHTKLNDVDLTLNPGQVLIVKPGDIHQDYGTFPLKYIWLNFEISYSYSKDSKQTGLFDINCPPKHQIITIEQCYYRPLLMRLQEECEKQDHVAMRLQDTITLEIFWLFLRQIPKEALAKWYINQSEDQAFANKLNDLFRANISKSLKVPEMAVKFGMSESSFAHKTRDVLGISPQKAFLTYKMEIAAELVLNTKMSIKDIAFYLGYDTPFHFSRSFKNFHKKAPNFYRNKK